jgi:hypothetical protein
MEQFLSSADRGGLSRGLMPTREEYAQVFAPGKVDALHVGLDLEWQAGEIAFAPDPPLTAIALYSVSREELLAEAPLAAPVPPQYRELLAPHLLAGTRLWVATFTDPAGVERGIRIEGLCRVGECWRVFPHAWRYLE